MQQHPVPAGAEDDIHFARRAGARLQIDQGLAQGLLGLGAPAVRGDPGLEAGPPAGAREAGLPASIALDGDLDIDTRQRAHIADQPSVRPEDLHGPLLAGERRHHLHNPRIPGPAPGVDLLEQGDLGLEVGRVRRVDVVIEAQIGRARPFIRCAGVAAPGEGRGPRSTLQGGLRDFAGVSVARRLSRHDAQTEPVGGVEGGGFQPSVVEEERLTAGPLQENLTVVGVPDRLGEHAPGGFRGQAVGLKEGGGFGVSRHEELRLGTSEDR